MLLMAEKDIRRGIYQYAKPNNNYIKYYNGNKESSHHKY